ncbi:hypothetical protein N0V87_010531 [Didymella glomerata]|uniref:C3H1-type domain-containing protein n=1 Tax=Didymella glomerata TaxID=749621 RepID=A0A9W8WPD7_9PLEO|nr:hypothetical protein N0V87_010531 [Didymella glomerata]
MSTPPETDFATQIMHAAITFDTPAVPPTPAMSPTEKIADLECQIKALKVRKQRAEKRAAERYKQMLHATRHAERTQVALKRETEDKLDSEMKAIKAFHALKQKIADLEHENAQEQRSARTFTQLQELQSANNRLQAQLAQEKEAFADVQHTLKQMNDKSEEDKEEIRLQAKEAYDKGLAERQKLWKEEHARRSVAATQKQSQELASIRKENERLKQQLQKSQQTIEWYKAQLQQQPAQRAGVQNSPTAAGIHAGFPLATQQSPSQVTHQRKRRRANSTSYVGLVVSKYVQADVNSDGGLPAPEQEGGNANNLATPKRRKIPAGNRKLSQNPATPTRLPQGLNTNSSPVQPVQQAQVQAKAHEQAVLMQAQRTGNTQRFRDFVLRANASRRNAGRSQLNIVQLWHVFSRQLAQEGSPQPSASTSGDNSSQAKVSGNFARMQNLPQGGGQLTLQSSFQAPATPLIQHAHHSFNNQSPFSTGALDFGAAGWMQTPQLYQQSPRSASQNHMQSPAMSNMSFNPMLTLTAGDNTNSPAMSFTNVSFDQAIPKKIQDRGDDLNPSAQSPARFQDDNLYPSPPGNLQGAQSANESIDLAEILGWASPTPILENNFLEGAGDATFGNINFQISGNDVTNGSFSATTNSSTSFPSLLQDTEASSHPSSQQQDSSRPTLHESQQTAVNRALFSGAAETTNVSMDFARHSQPQHDRQSTPHQHQYGEAPSIISIRSSQPSPDNAPKRPTAARKRPMAAPSSPTRSTTPATGGQDFPVCLNCHKKWWNETCDAGEPCQNCSLSGRSCERPKCHLEPGKCTNARCSRVHEGDTRFRYVVQKPKTLKRKGKMGDAVDSPVVMMRTH